MIASVGSSDELRGIDPGTTAQGHVSQTKKQVFTLLRQRTVQQKKLKMECEEFLYRDQFGNAYMTYRAMLSDGEVYDTTAWIGKVVAGGVIKPVREFKKFVTFSDDMIDCLRMGAFVTFGRTTVELMKARDAAGATHILSADEANAAAEGVVTSIMAAGQEKKIDEPVLAPILPICPKTPPPLPLTNQSP